jgi:hypothetical protein
MRLKKELTKKEQLQKELNAIAKQEHKEMIDANYPEFKKLEGRFFKYKNSYSLPEKPSDYWWLYQKVIEIKPEDIYMGANGPLSHYRGWSFQTDKHGTITIENNKHGYVHGLEKEITEAEFNEAWNKMVERLSNLP